MLASYQLTISCNILSIFWSDTSEPNSFGFSFRTALRWEQVLHSVNLWFFGTTTLGYLSLQTLIKVEREQTLFLWFVPNATKYKTRMLIQSRQRKNDRMVKGYNLFYMSKFFSLRNNKIERFKIFLSSITGNWR